MAVRSDNDNVIVKLGEEVTAPAESCAQSLSPSSQQYRNGLDIGESRHLKRGSSKFTRVYSLAVRNRSRAKSMDMIRPAPRRGPSFLTQKTVQAPRSEKELSHFSWWMNFKRKIWIFIQKRMHKAKHRNVFQSAIYTFMNSGLYKLILTLTVLLHAIIMSLYQPETKSDFQPINMLIYYLTIGFLLFYCLEAVLNIIAYGLILHPKHAYFRQPLFIFDLIIILLGILYLSLRFHSPVFAEVCSALMALKFIKILAFSQSVQSILDALARSFLPLSYLAILTGLIILFLALLGIELFQGRLHGGCYANYTTPAGDYRSVLVSSFPCNLNEDLGSIVVGAHICPFNSVCQEWELGPKFGIASFDDIFRALVVVFQVITLEGWSAVYFLYESSLGFAYCWVYFIVVTILGSIFILNLITGVLTNVFKGFNSKSLEEEQKREKIREQQLTELNEAANLHKRQIEERKSRFHSFLMKALKSVQDQHQMCMVKWDKWQSPRCLEKFQQKVYKTVKSKIWLWINITAHAVNLILLMSLHFPSTPSFNLGINIANSVFSVYYILEVAIRLYGIGPIRFFNHSYFYQTLANCAEAILAVVSILFLILSFTLVIVDEQFNLVIILNALWSIKIVLACKPFKKSWKHLKEVLNTVGKLLKPILGLGALVLLFLFIYTNMGLRIFGTKLHLTNANFQPNFDDIGNSFFLVFQLLTTEDWHNTLYSSTGAIITEEGETVGIISTFYFMIGLVIGFFVLVTVFLALAVDELSEVESAENEDEEDEEDEEKSSTETSSEVQQEKPSSSASSATKIYTFEEELQVQSPSFPNVDPSAPVIMSKGLTKYFNKGGMKRFQAQNAMGDNENTLSESSTQYSPTTRPRNISFLEEETSGSAVSTSSFQEHYVRRRSSLESLPKTSLLKNPDNSDNNPETFGWKKLRRGTKMLLKEMHEYFGTFIWDPSKELEKIPPHSAFFIINPQSRFRRACFAIVTSQTFQIITIATIFLSSLLLTLEIPIGVSLTSQLCPFQRASIYLDIIFVSFFLVETFLKMISLGVIVHRGSYLRGVFNSIDFIVTIFNLIPIVVFLMNWDQQIRDICISYGYDIRALPGYIGTLRVIRVLRPLRAIRIKGFYLVVTGLISSMKAMGSVFFFDIIVLVIFGVIGVHIFKGSFYSCSDPTIQIEGDCVGQYFKYDYTYGANASIPGLECPVAQPREWTNVGLNFNNIGIGFVSLFVMLTSEGWQNVMYSGVNSRRPLNTQTAVASMQDSSRVAAIYFILYMIFMTFILIQLLVGFVIVTFQQVGIKPYKETKLDRNQRSCLQLAITTHAKYKWTPKNKTIKLIRDKLLPLVESNTTRTVVGLALVLNVFCLCLKTYKEETLNMAVYYINVGFTMFFAVEALVKMSILAPKVYFHKIWNTCEFAIAAGSVLEFILQQTLKEPILPQSHLVSTLRTLTLLRFVPEVRRILWTVIRSFKIFPWVGYLMLIIGFIYAVIGMNLFGDIVQGTVDQSDDVGIHEYNNYGNFPAALLLIFRVSTGENWQDVMLNSDSGQACNNCTGLFVEGDTCGNNVAIPFYISFYIITVILVLNLFVSVIIDHFEYVTMDKSELSDYDLKKFINAWSIYDPEGTGQLTIEEVFQMLRNLEPPVGWGIHCPDNVAYRNMMHLCIPIVEVEESVEDGRTQKVQKITFNATLMALVRYALDIECGGCPRCQKICNHGFKEKLIKCFPDIKHEIYDSVLASEKDCTVAEMYAALLLQRHWMNLKKRRRQNYEMNLINKEEEYLQPNPVGGLSPDVASDELARSRLQTMQVPNLQIQGSHVFSETTNTPSSAEKISPVNISIQPPESTDGPTSPASAKDESQLSTSFIKAARHLSVGIFLDNVQLNETESVDETTVAEFTTNTESQC